MPIKQIIYLILLIFTISSCENKKTIEEQILSQISLQLIDSLQINWKPLLPPPPPIYDGDSIFKGIDSVKMEQILVEQEKFLKRIDSIDSRIYIGVRDTCFSINWTDLKTRTHSQDSLISIFICLYEKENRNPKKLSLEQIKVDDRYKLISETEIEKEYPRMWPILRDYKFAGLLDVSKIYLTKNYDFGLLQIDYHNHELNSYSYFLIIENKNDIWKVKRLLRNWVT